MELKKNTGITLVALIVSIIVMLILAGVSINAVIGENGIITQAINAADATVLASEKEAIQYLVVEAMTDNSESSNAGTALYDKTLANGSIWNIVVINDTQTVYGTGWYYIEAGTELDNYGETVYGWLINYDTGEIIQLEDDSYTQLNYSSSLAVTDNLILNIDSGVIEDSDDSLTAAEQIANVESQLGDNITLVGFDEDDCGDSSGLTSTSFNFDGVDDYIQIQYDSDEEKETLAENGFTFEFYGTIAEGSHYIVTDSETTDITDSYEQPYTGIFCYWNGVETNQARFRFGLLSNYLLWNASYASLSSDFSHNSGDLWNQYFKGYKFTENEQVYITITLDCTSTFTNNDTIYYIQTLYINGNLISQGGYNKEAWDYFINENSGLSTLVYFCMGRSSYTEAGYWHYSNMQAYSLRLYARGLTEDEVLENYNTSVAYHTLLESTSE